MALVFTFPALLLSQNVDALNDSGDVRHLHSVYAEFLGNKLPASVNYDYSSLSGFGFRLGVGFTGLDRTDRMSIPITANYLIGELHQLELGLGVELWEKENDLLPITTVGYRYQQKSSGIMYRITLNPIIVADKTTKFGIPISISIGYTL
jgi:hypothetical protein